MSCNLCTPTNNSLNTGLVVYSHNPLAIGGTTLGTPIKPQLSGTESIYYANRSQTTYTGKEEGKDHLCYEGEGSMLKLQAGYFCILFPDDVHKTKSLQT